MAKDFTALVAKAQALLADFGREVTLVSFDETSADPAKPWEGATAPRGSAAGTLVVNAVFVEPVSAARLGFGAATEDLTKRFEQVAVVVPGVSADLDGYEEVLDGDQRWKVEQLQVLKPGSQTLLAFLGLRR